MKATSTWAVLLGSLTLLLTPIRAVWADEIPAEYRATVAKGLEWMAKNQHKDGHWEAFGGQYPMTMTGVGGMALLMEGSTIREGKYRDNIKRAVDWLMGHSMPNGMLGNPNMPGEAGRYMYGHGFGMMFLACVYGEEEEGDRRQEAGRHPDPRGQVFPRRPDAAQVAARRQDRRGRLGLHLGEGRQQLRRGLGDGHSDAGPAGGAQRRHQGAAGSDQGRPWITWKRSTNGQGGVIYSLGGGGGGDGRPALTAAAIACGFSAGDYNSPLVKKWFKFCQQNLAAASAAPASATTSTPTTTLPRPFTSSARTATASCSRIPTRKNG